MINKYSACVIIINPETGKLLTVSRKDNHKDLGLSGGKHEPGETIKQCAVRELKEETGLIVLEDDLIEVYSTLARTSICTTFYATKYSGEISSSEEGLVTWATWDDIKDPLTTFHKYNCELHKAFKELKLHCVSCNNTGYLSEQEGFICDDCDRACCCDKNKNECLIHRGY